MHAHITLSAPAVVHVLFFGSSSDTLRKLLHGPAFFLSHSVLAGWLQLTYFNPQIDLKDKEAVWGCTWRMSIPRTVVAHILTVVAHWALLIEERTDLRRLHAGMGVKDLVLRGVLPQLALLVVYGQLFHNLTSTYGIKTVDNERLHVYQTYRLRHSSPVQFPGSCCACILQH
jgi:uncharacterized protein YjiS (DUF1127 family)